MALIKIHALKVMMKYVVNNNGSLYFQRAVPRDLLARFPKKLIRVPLGKGRTVDTVEAMVDRLAQDTQRMFEVMRNDRSMMPAEAKRAVNMLFASLGIKIDSNGIIEEIEIEKFEDAYAEAFNQDPSNTGAFRVAQRFLHGHYALLLSECANLYIREKGLRDGAKDHQRVIRDWNRFLEVCGDSTIQEISRETIRSFVDKRIAQGAKTGTVRRELNTLRACVSMAIRERRLNFTNPFDRIAIPQEARDVTQKDTLSIESLKKILNRALLLKDELRTVAILQMHTGMRIGEAVGLRVKDVRRSAGIVYVSITPHASRSLKTASSIREVPLVGSASIVIEDYLACLPEGQAYLFGRYASDEQVKSDNASAAMAKWLRTLGLSEDATSHCFRHTLEDLLREANVTKSIQKAIGGWGASDMTDNYGKGLSIKIKYDSLTRALSEILPSTIL
jgi:integrase